MDNNKNLMKTEEKSNAEIRKMFPKDGPEIIKAMDNRRVDHHGNDKEYNKQQGQSMKNTTTREL
jgi:hypothetical protein